MTDNENSDPTQPPAVPPAPVPPPAMPAATPPPPAMPAATPPPPPMGQPGYPQQPGYTQQPGYQQPGYPQPYAGAPAPGTRSTGKFVVGIILTSIGGLWTLFGLRSIGVAIRTFGDNPGFAAGSIVGGVLIPIAMLVIGIALIRSSKRKA
jgi:hypothetical protein